ncbi:DNA-3-methyladenine glycosylase 2 family protein [Desulfitobacterium sp.]|uniref:DNA-3-methyladenine glycosylase family protein n=1 Tax=Desulfitobacterium sp. TaxID=49981 RepID=UPI002C615EC8|nr:DNA-3-methyladenine glycosylase 2 family protein [Desulfitobacterium sp.]HVJ49300.1 DNA-3-methyladenine glycosylase 2 family protein [Desulfitobacterium sp.]
MQTVKTKFFDYSQKEVDYLKSADETLGTAMERMGRVERVIIPDLFATLIYAIVGQLISVKAVHTIWDRMQERFGEIMPVNISSRSADEIQGCGITMRKAVCIKDIAKNVAQGEFNLNELYVLSDEDIIKRLSSLKGIGKWTAEMLLLNSMERPDVISWGDIAIRRGIMKLYGLTDLTKEQFDEYRKRYSPYGSVASIYLWKLSFEK